jgi:hypothetical protein
MNAYRFLLADKGKAISWYIALVGKKPIEDAEQKVTALLMQGEITQLDERVVKQLAADRAEQSIEDPTTVYGAPLCQVTISAI